MLASLGKHFRHARGFGAHLSWADPIKCLPVTIQTPSIFSGTLGAAFGIIRACSTVFHFVESTGGARDSNCRTRAESSATVNVDSDHFASPTRSVDPASSALTMSHSLALPCHHLFAGPKAATAPRPCWLSKRGIPRRDRSSQQAATRPGQCLSKSASRVSWLPPVSAARCGETMRNQSRKNGLSA